MSYPIAIDIKKNRIRLHKAMLKKLGNPKYIQLLINPEKMVIAIVCGDKEYSGDQSHKIDYRKQPKDSIELYSRSLVTKIYELINGEMGYSYRIDGEVYANFNMALFPLTNLKKIDIS